MNKDKTTAITATANHSTHIGILALSKGNFIINSPYLKSLKIACLMALRVAIILLSTMRPSGR